jgi:hypothetical protein
MRTNQSDCNHPVSSRTDLSKDDGFHCENCGVNIKVIPLNEPKAQRQVNKMFTSQREAATEAPKARAKKGSKATVKVVRLNADEEQLAKKDEVNQRKEYLRGIEANAKRLIKGIEDALATGEQISALRIKFVDTVRELLPLFENVQDGFRHLRKGESIMGMTTAKAWSLRYLKVTYQHLARVIRQLQGKSNPPALLLMDGSKVLGPTETAIDGAVVTPEPIPPTAKKESQREPTVEQPTQPNVMVSLADTKPSFAIGVSPADVLTNTAHENARSILNYVRSYGKHMNAAEWEETVRLVIEGLQYELDDAEHAVEAEVQSN